LNDQSANFILHFLEDIQQGCLLSAEDFDFK